MKIAHVIGRLVPEGAEIFVCNLCKNLSSLHEVQLWVLGEKNESEFQVRILKELGARSITIHFLGKRHKTDRWRTIVKLRNLIKRERPDIINTHLEYVGALVSAASLFLKTKQVQTIHSVAISSKSVLKMLAARKVHFVAISRILMEHYARELSLPLSLFTLVLNGTDLSEFPHRERTLQPVIRFLSVGRLETPKDFASLIRAGSMVREQTSQPFTIHIYGQGSLLPALQALITQEKMEQLVFLPGHSNAISEIMYTSDVYVVSSRWEGLSIALIEAMSSGMPLIATNVGGNPEVVFDGTNGFLVEKEDPAAIAGAMLKFMRDPGLITRFSCAQKELRNEFDIKSCVEKYISLYMDLQR